jgi:cell division protein FtsW (lipid II flippase)
VWDAKRQVIWLAGGLALGTFVVYQDSHDEIGRFDPQVFVFWETILLIIIAVMFYFYSRRRD